MNLKIVWSALIASILLINTSETSAQNVSEIPPAPREMRGVWVATVGNIDWPSKPGLSTRQQQAELIALFDRFKELNLNAVFFQVRTSADALYHSSLEPWSEFLSGKMGERPNPFYDPLQFAIEQAHERGLELHAWFNPYRARYAAAIGPASRNHISVARPDLAKKYGKLVWMDPGAKEVQDHSFNVIMDVLRRYDVDGIHFDDYFYPYKEKDSSGKIIPFPDAETYQQYRAAGGKLSLDDWRRENVDSFIRRVAQGIKAEKPWVRFGISPFGIWRPGNPPGISGLDAYADLYADARKWIVEGWLDYAAPQLYWPINRSAQSYPKLLEWWVAQNRKGRHLWVGNFTSQIANGKEFSAKEIVDQIEVTRRQQGASGNIHFSARAFTKNMDGINERLRSGPYAGQALAPASTWLDSTPPGAPVVRLEQAPGQQTDRVTLRWQPSDNEPVWLWAVYGYINGAWRLDVVPANQNSYAVSRTGANAPSALAIAAVDRVGNESPRSFVSLTQQGVDGE